MLFLTKFAKHDFLDTCAQIRIGSFRLHTPEGDIYDFGNGSPACEMQIYDWSVVTAIAARGDIGLGESYVAGLWHTPSIADLAEVALKNSDHFRDYAHVGFWSCLKFAFVNRLLRANSQRRAARNIRAHYDVGNEFYQMWLDEGMTYSSAMFTDDDSDLSRGQKRKYDRILNRLTGTERVLEIGCRWGGFAERAADRGHHVTGLTISPSQKGYADARLDGRADILLQDYRKSAGTFDSIVSIEMIETVGENYWPVHFATLKARLADYGRVVIQAITVPDGHFDIYRQSSDYIRHHTFPGGMLLSNAVIARQARLAGLVVTNTYAFGADYARTCAIWSENLGRKSGHIKRLGFDERFLRSWRHYLGICTAPFALRRTDVVQVELSHA